MTSADYAALPAEACAPLGVPPHSANVGPMTPLEAALEAARHDERVTANAITEARGRRCATSVMFRVRQAHQRARERVRAAREALRYLQRVQPNEGSES